MTLFNWRNLAVSLSYEVKNLKRAQEFADSVDNIRAGAEKLASMARKAALAGSALTAGLVHQSNKLAENASLIQRNATAVGISVEKYQELEYAFSRLDLNANDLMDTMTQVADRVQAASTGSKNYQQALKKLNLRHKDLMKMNPADAMLEVVNATRGLENHMERAAIAATLLGEESARKLLPAMVKNGKALSDYMKLARAAGIIMDKKQVAAANRLKQSFENIRLVARAMRNQFVLSLMPMLTKYADKITQAYLRNKEFIKQKLDDYAKRIEAAVNRLAGSFKRLDKQVEKAGGWEKMFSRLANTFVMLTGLRVAWWLGSILAGMKGLFTFVAGVGLAAFAKFLLAVVVIGSAFVVLVAAVEDAMAEMSGAKSITGALKKNFDKLNPVAKIFAGLWILMTTAIQAVYKAVETYMLPALKRLLPLLKVIIVVVGIMIGVLVLQFIGAVAMTVAVITILANIIGFLWDLLVGMGEALYMLGELFVEFAEWLGETAAKVFLAGEEFVAALKKMNPWQTFLNEMIGLFESFDKLLGDVFDTLGEVPAAIGNALGDLPGALMEIPMAFLGEGLIAPATTVPMTAGAGAGGGGGRGGAINTTVNGQTTINVNGSGDPETTARKVAEKQQSVNDGWANSAYQQGRTGNR